MTTTMHSFGPNADFDAMPFDDLTALAIAIDLALSRQMLVRLSPESIEAVSKRQRQGWALGSEVTCNASARAFVRLVGVAPDGQQREQYADTSKPLPTSKH